MPIDTTVTQQPPKQQHPKLRDVVIQKHEGINLDSDNELLPHDHPQHPHHRISVRQQETVTWQSGGPFTITSIRQIGNPTAVDNPFFLNFPAEAVYGSDGIFRVNSGAAKTQAIGGRFKINFKRSPAAPEEDPDVFVDP